MPHPSCPVCHKRVIRELVGTDYRATFDCPRCKTRFRVTPGGVEILAKEEIAAVGRPG